MTGNFEPYNIVESYTSIKVDNNLPLICGYINDLEFANWLIETNQYDAKYLLNISDEHYLNLIEDCVTTLYLNNTMSLDNARKLVTRETLSYKEYIGGSLKNFIV